MITPLGFALRVLFFSVFGFIGFIAFGCFALWASMMVINWLSDKREEMEEFRNSEEYKEDTKECEIEMKRSLQIH